MPTHRIRTMRAFGKSDSWIKANRDRFESALISDCGQYRYHLQRTWGDTWGKRLCYIMLNPSTADGLTDDATIRICVGRAKRMGMSGIDVVNLFAYRSTDPARLYEISYPISEPTQPDLNTLMIESYARHSAMVICAWGRHGILHERGRIVLSALRQQGIQPHALRLNKDGSPAHPLRIGYDQQPFPF